MPNYISISFFPPSDVAVFLCLPQILFPGSVTTALHNCISSPPLQLTRFPCCRWLLFRIQSCVLFFEYRPVKRAFLAYHCSQCFRIAVVASAFSPPVNQSTSPCCQNNLAANPFRLSVSSAQSFTQHRLVDKITETITFSLPAFRFSL